jgi:SAM-dependent methyltransferase
MNIPFPLPVPAGCSDFPVWDGQAYVFDGKCTPVLEYSENFAGWSDDLTTLHEEAAGDSHPIDQASRQDAIAQLRQFLPVANAVIMEIGCSSGFLIKDLVKTFPEVTVIGADVVKYPLYRLAKELPGVPLMRFDLLQCPLPDQSVDVLIMLNVLEHIDDDITALKNAYKLLKRGGVLIIEVPAGPYLYDQYDSELHHFRRYSATELQRKLVQAGFKTLRKSHLGFVIFPVFVLIKLLNKWSLFHNKNKVVREQAAKTSNNRWVKLAMSLELKCFARLSLPMGIRVLTVAQRGDLT